MQWCLTNRHCTGKPRSSVCQTPLQPALVTTTLFGCRLSRGFIDTVLSLPPMLCAPSHQSRSPSTL
eukprot:6270969-Amphidinium_carterae.1